MGFRMKKSLFIVLGLFSTAILSGCSLQSSQQQMLNKYPECNSKSKYRLSSQLSEQEATCYNKRLREDREALALKLEKEKQAKIKKEQEQKEEERVRKKREYLASPEGKAETKALKDNCDYIINEFITTRANPIQLEGQVTRYRIDDDKYSCSFLATYKSVYYNQNYVQVNIIYNSSNGMYEYTAR
jgi:hypothetical protein